jgi:hypothetical protein
MSGGILVAIIVILIIILAIITVPLGTATRRRRLQERFGPEYERVLGERQSRRTAETELAARERRVRKLRLHDLTADAKGKYAGQWIEVQERFVDEPSGAIADAQALVETVMRERGYPASEYQQTVADLSVAHARTLDHFRAAHEISARAVAGNVATEELRIALLHYRELFSELLGVAMTGDDHAAAA